MILFLKQKCPLTQRHKWDTAEEGVEIHDSETPGVMLVRYAGHSYAYPLAQIAVIGDAAPEKPKKNKAK